MRVYISADIEGTAGVSGRSQTAAGAEGYQAACRLMTQEVNAAVEGAFSGGATQVVVNDSHGQMLNLILELLDPRADLLHGSPKPWSMVEGLDGSYDLMVCTGYHARAGAAGTLAHTYSGAVVHEVTLCGRPVGEYELNTYLAGTYGVPVAAVSGDDVLEGEVAALSPSVHFARVKEARGRFGSLSLGAERSREAIRKAVETACRAQDVAHLEPPKAPDLIATFMHAGQAQVAALCPGSERVSPVAVRFGHPDYREVFRAFRAMITLASTV